MKGERGAAGGQREEGIGRRRKGRGGGGKA